MTLSQTATKITAIGSSATRGFKIDQQDAWPEQLEVVCRDAGWDVSVANRATHGLAISAFAERVLHIERSDPQDIYLFQIPISSRIYFGVNGSRRLREEDFEKDVLFGWSEKSAHISPTRVLLTGGSLDEKSPFHKYLKSFFFPIIKRNNPNADYDEFLSFIRFWEANIRDSDLELIAYTKEILLLQQLMARLQKNYLMFQWCGPCLQNFAHRTQPFYSLIDWNAFALEGAKTAFDYLKTHHADSYSDLLNDEYHHLNRAGNRVIAEQFVLPELLRRQANVN